MVGAVSNALPKGALKRFVDGRVSKAGDAMFGLVVSGAITTSKNSKGETNYGGEIGIKKGFNVGGSVDVEYTAGCTFQTGCY
jgi:hypothetical protein